MYSYDQVLADVRHVYEQLTGLPAPNVDVRKPRFPLPEGVDPMALVQSEINHLNLFLINSGISLRMSKAPSWMPPGEVYETSGEYLIRLELAGLDEKDLEVQAIGNILVVRGTRRFRRPSEEAQYHASERSYGTFERLFQLPNYVNAENRTTKLEHGIYEVSFQKIGGAAGAGTAKVGAQRAGQESARDKDTKK